MTELAWLGADAAPDEFPPVHTALTYPEGLLAAGGDLSPERLLAAYPKGIFPWYEAGQPVLWWSPDPRTVIEPARFHASRSLKRRVRRLQPDYRFDGDFAAVIRACQAPRDGQQGTWITADMVRAFERLYALGYAHCIEVLDGQTLIGGVYGLAIGRVFFGESMFSRASDGSKMALLALCRWMTTLGMPLLDCQVRSPHLLTLGATTMPRERFLAALARYCSDGETLKSLPRGCLPLLSLLTESP